MESWLLLLGFGVLAGFLGGVFGVGGGVVFAPLLTWWLAQQGYGGSLLVELVLSNSLALTLLTGVLGWGIWLQKGVFTGWDVLRLGLPSAIASVVMAHAIRNGAWYDQSGFRVFFSFMLGLVLFRNAQHLLSIKNPPINGNTGSIHQWALPGLGLIAGIFSALSGLGGGAIMVPILQRWRYRDQASINALSMGSIAVMALASTVYYWTMPSTPAVGLSLVGRLIPSFLAPCAMGTLLGLLPGIRLAGYLTQNPQGERNLRWALLFFLGSVLLWVNRSFMLSFNSNF
ncbi:MAG: TSUP family transporter [Bacteroidia bacterium]